MEEAGKGFLAPLLRLLGLKGAQARWLQAALLLGALGVVMLLIGSPAGVVRAPVPPPAAPPAPPAAADDLTAYEDALARRLEAILSRVAGVGWVKVEVTVASGPGKVVQVDQKRTSRLTQEKDTSGGTRQVTETEESGQMVLVHGGSSAADAPVVLRLERPAVVGVVVVAQGAGNPRVREELTRTASIALQVPLNRVEVQEGR